MKKLTKKEVELITSIIEMEEKSWKWYLFYKENYENSEITNRAMIKWSAQFDITRMIIEKYELSDEFVWNIRKNVKI